MSYLIKAYSFSLGFFLGLFLEAQDSNCHNTDLNPRHPQFSNGAGYCQSFFLWERLVAKRAQVCMFASVRINRKNEICLNQSLDRSASLYTEIININKLPSHKYFGKKHPEAEQQWYLK